MPQVFASTSIWLPDVTAALKPSLSEMIHDGRLLVAADGMFETGSPVEPKSDSKIGMMSEIEKVLKIA